MLQRGYNGDGCDLASTLYKYDLRKGDLFVLSWASVRGVRWGSVSSELLMCGGDDSDSIFRRTLLGYYAEGKSGENTWCI